MKPIDGVKIVCKTEIPRKDRVVHHHPLLGLLRIVWLQHQHRIPVFPKWKWKGRN